MTRFFCITILLLLGVSQLIYAQQTRTQKLDSLYNDPFFYSTVSAIILPKGFVEVNNFGSLFTTNELFTSDAKRQNLNARLSQFVNLLQISYGTSASSRFNVGVDLQYSSLRVDIDPQASPFRVFGRDSALINDQAFTHVGLRFRWKPVARNRKLLVQGSVYQPIYKPDENLTSLRMQVVYVFELSRRLFLYAQPGLTYNIPKKSISGSVAIPLTALFQFQLTPRLGLMGLMNHSIGLARNAERVFSQTSRGSQVGTGVQFQPLLRLGITGFVTQYLAGKNTGVYRTANLGLRVIL
ncbi:hypothetical protein GGR92_002390 [Spirosoma lacussanchae]|uniref:porin family protein n=1 Tax=Spirosoma lacussanchae TaxID=1884249 RepID=UPI001108939C|nr:porin family protein [Spirosoma lacussanchae]